MPKTYKLQGDAHMKAVFPFITLLWLTGLSCTQALPPTPAPTPTQTSTPVPTPLLTPDIAATVQASVKAAIESVSTAMPIPTALPTPTPSPAPTATAAPLPTPTPTAPPTPRPLVPPTPPSPTLEPLPNAFHQPDFAPWCPGAGLGRWIWGLGSDWNQAINPPIIVCACYGDRQPLPHIAS